MNKILLVGVLILFCEDKLVQIQLYLFKCLLPQFLLCFITHKQYSGVAVIGNILNS